MRARPFQCLLKHKRFKSTNASDSIAWRGGVTLIVKGGEKHFFFILFYCYSLNYQSRQNIVLYLSYSFKALDKRSGDLLRQIVQIERFKISVVRVIDESADHRVVDFWISVKHPHYLAHVVSATSVMEVEETKLSAHRTKIALYFFRVIFSILDVPSKKDHKLLGQMLGGYP